MTADSTSCHLYKQDEVMFILENIHAYGKPNLSLIMAQGRAFCVPKMCYWFVMSVNHDVSLSCIQQRANNH